MSDSCLVAVHLHLFHHDMWEGFAEHLNNLDNCRYMLFVTLVVANPDLEKRIKAFKADAKIHLVPNNGYDVGPFVHFLNHINLDDYDYILKLHSKSLRGRSMVRIDGKYITRRYWYKLLMESLIGTNKIWNKNISLFEQDEKLGMVGSKYLIVNEEYTSEVVAEKLPEAMERVGFDGCCPIKFIAGTMFIARAKLFKSLAKAYTTIDEFEESNPQMLDGTLAHVLERVLGCMILKQGYSIKGVSKDFIFEIYSFILAVKRFLFQKKTTRSNKTLIKVCKIPVYSRKK